MSQCLSNLCGIEAAIFEKAHLLGALLRIVGLTSKFLTPRVAREFVPIDLGRLQRAAHQRLFHAALFEFLLYTARAVAARGAATDEGVGIASILLQAFIDQVIERDGNIVVLEALERELALQLAATVFAPCERADREVARRTLRVVAQASSNSSRSSSSAPAEAAAVAALEVIATARMLASISSAIFGLSFKNWRTLSLPCPMRSPL